MTAHIGTHFIEIALNMFRTLSSLMQAVYGIASRTMTKNIGPGTLREVRGFSDHVRAP